jgi:hypothetical protein
LTFLNFNISIILNLVNYDKSKIPLFNKGRQNAKYEISLM